MKRSRFRTLVQDYLVDLLNAPTLDKRAQICQEIADDPRVTTSIIMSLMEQLRPLLPPATQPTDQESFIQ